MYFILHPLILHQQQLHHGTRPVDPETYELVVNYRSHGGIVNCARSVIELITLYWPHSIDVLKPERASVDGFQPIFFSSQGNVILFPILPWSNHQTDTPVNSMILRGHFLVMAKESQLNLGQINVGIQILFLSSLWSLLTWLKPGILVRDNDSRQQLKKRLGDRSIIM